LIKEWLARGVIILGMLMVVSIPVVNYLQPSQPIVMHARMADSGGWSPASLTTSGGQPLRLRLTSDDVTHGFAVGQLDQPAVEIRPGEMTDVTLVFSHPGKYTFYCTRWCGVNHWRMRGTIEVTGYSDTQAPTRQPLYVTLGMNIDASHQASVTPGQIPSAWRGALLNKEIPSIFTSRDYYLSHTPVDLWLGLRAEATNKDLSDEDVWDLVAWVWQANTTPDQIQAGQRLFASNCAACHGEGGAGNGVYAGQLAAGAKTGDSGRIIGEHTLRPANFTDPSQMLSASPAHLQGKIIRGGMGTGMPSWGAIFTEEQTWALVAYLWSFQFQLEINP